MRWRIAAAFFLIWWCLSLTAFGIEDTAQDKQKDDAQVFLEALALSYNGDHVAARQKFQEYGRNHPDDLLGPLRIFYDRFFDVHSSKMDEKQYRELLRDVNRAISIFETKACTGTDLREIAGNTLDCEYVGAALYSFREVLFLKNHWILNLKAEVADDRNFFLHASRSASLQAVFLVGVHEYEKSEHFFGKGREQAIQKISASLNDKSPFRDDIWFFVLRMEAQKKDGMDGIARRYSAGGISARLKASYPNNRFFRDSTDSFEKLR